MKKNILFIMAILLFISISSCDDMLDTDNLYEKSSDNFYNTPQDIDEAIVGMYNSLYCNISGNEHVIANLLSDVCLGGGGAADTWAHSLDAFSSDREDVLKDLWVHTYQGVNRANGILENLPGKDFSQQLGKKEGDEFINNALAEAYFMRAFYMFRAAKLFGPMPLMLLSTTDSKTPRAPIEDVYAWIAHDLKKAIDLFSEVDVQSIPVESYGHANKWVAQAYMAKLYLFYTGYMTNIQKQSTSEIKLPEDGGSITNTDVIAYLDECIGKSGYALVDDFRNLWPYSYVNTSAQKVVLPWADTEGLKWVGQDGPNSIVGTGNSEVMFAIRYSFGEHNGWQISDRRKYDNMPCLFFSPRQNSSIPWGEGWGWGPVHTKFFNDWDDTDTRKRGSVLEMGYNDQATQDYSFGNGYQQTELFNKKYMNLQHKNADGTGDALGMFTFIYGSSNVTDFQLWHGQDFYLMRYSDVLLMHSELTGDSKGIDAVRKRAGLDPAGSDLSTIKQERLHEFAFEGIRWFDLLRWGDVENRSNNYYSSPVVVKNDEVTEVYVNEYRSEIKGLMPVPESEIRLSEGVYQQNAGW